MVRLQIPNSAIASLLQSKRPAGRVAELGSLGRCTRMRLSTLLILVTVLAFACGCVTRGPKVLSKGSDTEIEAEALQTARADIAAGRPRVCYAGTVGVSAVGVPRDSLHLVRDLPRFPLPCGCTDPLAMRAYRFAEVYNTEVVHYLQTGKSQ
jgi:hypothetical protein